MTVLPAYEKIHLGGPKLFSSSTYASPVLYWVDRRGKYFKLERLRIETRPLMGTVVDFETLVNLAISTKMQHLCASGG